MAEYADIDEKQVRHLEMIQGVVSRLGTDSFLVKGWAVTVSGAFVGFAIGNKEWQLAAAGIVSALLFWGLDAHFLRAEKIFRTLHEAVRRGDVEPFFMNAMSPEFAPEAGKCSWLAALFSRTLAWFYLAVAASALIAALIIE